MELDSKYAKNKYELIQSIGLKVDAGVNNQNSNSMQSVPCIYRVPEKLRKLKEDAYSPRLVSIGPLHMRDQHLQAMEEHKVSYMHSLFRRTKKSDLTIVEDVNQTIDRCADAMLEEVYGARACYAESFDDDVKFAEIMLIDSCFILELLYRSQERYDKTGDPIFGSTLVLLDIRHDLVLLENQIPFFVLENLFQHTVKNIPNRPPTNRHSLPAYILRFFGNMMNLKCDISKKAVVSGDHILGILHKCYLPEPGEANNIKKDDLEAGGNSIPEDHHTITKYSATELVRSGVKLVAGKGAELNMKFILSSWFSWLCHCCGRTRLKITPFCIYDSTEPFFRNLIAYEQCSPGITRIITSYAFLMDTLIDSREDVELLEKAKVLRNNLGASEDASDLFNNICKEVVLGDFVFLKQWKQVDNYCNRYWPKHLASLRRGYFSNPWALVSVITALILFALAIVQSFSEGAKN